MISLTHPTPYKMVTFIKLEYSLEPLSTDTCLNTDTSLLWIVSIRISLYSKQKIQPTVNMDTLPCFESGMSSSFSTVRVRENFSYPLVLLASTILHLVVLNPRGFVQKVLLETQEQLII